MKKRIIYLATLFLLYGISNMLSAQKIRYVIPIYKECKGERDREMSLYHAGVLGSSWSDASSNLQLMIDISDPGDEVWVAAGTYTPLYPADISHDRFDIEKRIEEMCYYRENRNNAFVLKDGVRVYGGFQGWEVDLRERDWRKNETILSGQLFPSLRSYHVVISVDCGKETVLDGFTITRGNATGIQQVITVNGKAIRQDCGGGIYNETSQYLRLVNLIVTDNNAEFNAGGIYECNASGSFIMNTVINNNTAGFGAGIYFLFDFRSKQPSRSALKTVLITGNRSLYRGGGIYNAISELVLVNTTISGNACIGGNGGKGGGIYNATDPCIEEIKPVVRIFNSIIWGNGIELKDEKIMNIYNDEGTWLEYVHSCIESSSFIRFGTDLGGNIDKDPLFLNPLLYTQAPASGGDYRVNPESPVIDAGLFQWYQTVPNAMGTYFDLDGVRLPIDEIDMGAYEFTGK